MIWLTSDTHFGHKRIAAFTQRPYSSVEEMDEALIANWNGVVARGDTVYHLGDFAFSKPDDTRSVLRRLNGNKHLVLGNHDREIQRHPGRWIGAGLFATVRDAHYLRVDSHRLYLHHYGCRVWRSSHHGAIHLYGHSHGSPPPRGLSVDVGVDAGFVAEKYRPVSLDEVLAFMRERVPALLDYHGKGGADA